MKRRATSAEVQLISALKDFDAACTTAVDLLRRNRHARAEWALVRAGRKVALALGVPFDDHPLGDLVYHLEPCKITPADLARDKRVRSEGRASVLTPLISGAECAPGREVAAPDVVSEGSPTPVEHVEHSAPESASESVAS